MGGRLDEEQPMMIVGSLYKAGKAGSIEIAELMGQPPDQDVPRWHSASGSEAKALLDGFGAIHTMLRSEDQFVCAFAWNDQVFVTQPQKNLGCAYSCAIHHILLSKSAVT